MFTGPAECARVAGEHAAEYREGAQLAVISADGQHLAFWSDASNLGARDTNNAFDVFVRDRFGDFAGQTGGRQRQRLALFPAGRAR